MAKSVNAKAAKKTGNRRMKRTVRRTIGALCMVSAITVAAIPVPDIEAYNPNDADSKVLEYAQIKTASDPDNHPGTLDSTIPAEAAKEKLTMVSAGYPSLPQSGMTYSVFSKGNGIYELDWQFKYKANGGSGAVYSDAFITGFNNSFAIGDVDLSSSLLFSDYVYIEIKKDFDPISELTDTSVAFGSCSALNPNYDTEKEITVPFHIGDEVANAKVVKLGIQYTLDDDPVNWSQSNKVVEWFNKYFPDDLNYYKDKYSEYKTAIANGEEATPPPTITRSLVEHADYDSYDEQQAYLCDQMFGNGHDFGFSLVGATKKRYQADGTPAAGTVDDPSTEQIYLFSTTMAPQTQMIPNESYGHIFFADSQQFLTAKYIDLIGIGEGALYQVNNITDITLGGGIKYICDRAFSGATILTEINFGGNAKVGNQAFAECLKLRNVTLNGVTEIGKEAFANTIIDTIVIPELLTNVDDGAFYNCKQLREVIFEGKGTTPTTIGRGAFCDLENLNSVDFGGRNISQVGDYAFALTDPALIGKDKLTDFKYPDYITKGENLGEFTLANRQALKNVTLSSGLTTNGSYIISTGAGNPDVPDNLVAGCTNLEVFTFPPTTKDVTFDPTMFYDVTNSKFYVYGPEKSSKGFYANPRQCTWRAGMDVANNQPDGLPVTYMYYKDDNTANPETYEISNGFLIQGIDATGKLVNCTYVPDINEDEKDVDLIIPDSVAGKTINAIDSNCFDPDVKKNVTGIKIEDGNGIETIENDVFKDFDKITFVDLGNGVKTIGNTAFSDCDELTTVTLGENIESIGDGAFKNNPKLTEIHFDTPSDPTKLGLEDIGAEALATGSPKLTVFGVIDSGYGPFLWSMQEDNFVDPAAGVRVCYKTNEPTNLTVILDNTNLLPTLVDYPHYEDIDPDITARYEAGDSVSTDEQYLINNAINVVIPKGIKSIDVKGYINGKVDNSVTGLTNTKNVELYLKDNKNFDSYSDYGLFNGYYGPTNDSGEYTNKKTYTYGPADVYYLGKLGEKVTAGTSDTLPCELTETNPIGNDYIKSIVLNDVESIPDLAFYSCENLETIIAGNVQKVGELPVADCTALTSMAFSNDKYVANNGILYENLGGDKKKIVECFASRGNIGEPDIPDSDGIDASYFNNVAEIAEGAFSNCDEIDDVDFSKANNVVTIPEYCFYDCDKLTHVQLNEKTNKVNDYAFDVDKPITVEMPNKALYFSTNAFGDFDDKNRPTIRTWKSTEDAPIPADIMGQELGLKVKYYPNSFKIVYKDWDQTTKKTDIKESDEQSIPPVPGEDFPIRDGWEFVAWMSNGVQYSPAEIKKMSFTSDMEFVAYYEPVKNATPDVSGDVTPDPSNPTTPGTSGGVKTSPTPTKGSGGGGSSSSKTKYPLTVVYGSGSGQYPEGTKVIIEAIDAPAGKVFDKWVVTGAAATVYSSTSKATTVTTAAGETIITATYKDASSGSSSSSGGGGGASGTKTSTGTHNRVGADGSPIAGTGSSTRVDITKPGISDVDKAYASVSGSTDSFVVKITESADAANAVATALANKYGDMTPIKYFAMDISLYDATGTNKITDTTGLKVNVTIPIPDALRQYAGNNKVGAVVNGTQLEDLACKFTTVDGIPCVSFTATHFSPYTIYVDTNNLQVGYMDSSPKTGDPIHPKWFITIALAATSLFLFLKRDKVTIPVKA